MTQYVRRNDIEAAPLLEEAVVYNPERNNFCVLNRTAARIWEQLDKPADADDLAATLRGEFEVDDETTVEHDVQEALRQLKALGLIVPATGS